ncbi:hypothetical protein BDU57DRAFT_490976 [Ampelomyces quisqualis]|uniref:Secreted protein n=1 Tax=Ampelomyces quisqualis TaxID=50730 RepID=A0A6A5QYX7_AMPQU|nr:hypothetical protein BDU57DRAFT_490976 [Ampelomyces quisqualis]
MAPFPILFVSPLEPVLLFLSASAASLFQSRCKRGRVLPSFCETRVYLPMPERLLQVQTARAGDVAFYSDP